MEKEQNLTEEQLETNELYNKSKAEGLSEEEALELLKWTVNNTRDNLIIEGEGRKGIPEDVYGILASSNNP